MVASTQPRKLLLFLAAVAVLGVMGGLYETTFNNYLADVFAISDQARSNLELPREMPGFLVTVVAGTLAALALNRVGFVAIALSVVGLTGMALAPGRFWMMAVFMVVHSTGLHLNMPTSTSITLALAGKADKATRLGQVGAAGILGTIVGAAVVAFAMKPMGIPYSGIFLAAAAAAAVAALTVLVMGRVETHDQPRRKVFVFKRRYSRYYTLSALYGARKQVFMTFGPWVIVRIFHQPPATIAKLWIAYSLMGLFVTPLVGKLIDRVGERKVLIAEGLILSAVCATYAVAGKWPASSLALVAIMTVYVIDQMCFSVSMARTTYLSKLVETPEDLPAGLASGVSIDHLASMSLPMLGGLVWATWGFQYVFWGAACVALVSSAVSWGIRVSAAAQQE